MSDRGPRCPDCGAMVERHPDGRLLAVMTNRTHFCPSVQRAALSLSERIREALARCSRCNDHVLPMVVRGETQMFDVTRHDCRRKPAPSTERKIKDTALVHVE